MEVPQAPPASSLHPHDLTAERWICGGIDIGDPDADWYVEHKERRLYPWDARALYHRSPPTRLLASTEIINLESMKQCQRLAQITERLRARDREFVQCFYKRPAQYELFDWRLFALLYHRGEAFKAALSVTAVGGLQYWSVVHQALCDEAEELGLKERIRGHPKGEKALLHPGLMSMCSAFPRPNAGELRAQVMLLKQLVLGEIRSQNITFGEDVSDERKAVLKDIYDGRVEDSKAVVTELETEEGKCKARLDSLHWDGKAEALHWALHNRDIRRTVLHTGDGVTWMEDFANHPAQEPYDPREVRDPPTMLPSQPETDRQGRIDSGTSLLAPTGQTEPASSPPGVRTRSSRTTKPL